MDYSHLQKSMGMPSKLRLNSREKKPPVNQMNHQASSASRDQRPPPRLQDSLYQKSSHYASKQNTATYINEDLKDLPVLSKDDQ